MIKLFKSFGLGVLIVLTSPVWLLAFVLLLVLLIVKYFIGEILSFICFFRGYSYIEDDEYEEALDEVMNQIDKDNKKQKTVYVKTIPDKYIDSRFFEDNLDEEDENNE